MDDFLIRVASGVASTLIAALLIHWLGGGAPPRHDGPVHNSSTVEGDGNVVRQEDHSHTEIRYFRQVVQQQTGQDRSTGEGDNEWIVVALLVGVVAVLAYFLLWPVVVWSLVGAGVGVLLSVAATLRRTRGTSGPRTSLAALAIGTAACLIVSGWWLSHGGPGNVLSLPGLDAAVVERFPAFDDGWAERARVLWRHGPEIITGMGWSGFLLLLTHLFTLEAAVLLVLERGREVIGWRAYRQVQAGEHSERLVSRAERFLEVRGGAWVTLVVLGAAALLASGGWIASWITALQDHSFVA